MAGSSLYHTNKGLTFLGLLLMALGVALTMNIKATTVHDGAAAMITTTTNGMMLWDMVHPVMQAAEAVATTTIPTPVMGGNSPRNNADDTDEASVKTGTATMMMITLNTTAALGNHTLIRLALQQQPQGLQHSLRQQEYYHKRKVQFRQAMPWLDDALLYASPQGRRYPFGIQLHHDQHAVLAYRNIFKTGGTTISQGRKSLGYHKMQYLPWLVVVRDPIDHFLSGWGECGQRRQVRSATERWPYDERIRTWLNTTQTRARGGTHCSSPVQRRDPWVTECLCSAHSLAQANYLYNHVTGNLYDNVALVGDLRELPALLHLVGAPLPPTSRRNSTQYARRDLYPRRVDWLSNATLLELCRFLALDYWLLNYTPPAICQQELFTKWWSTEP